jgi:cysteine desulfuration protein SufE
MDGAIAYEGIAAAEAALLGEFELLDEPRDRIEHIIDLGRALPGLPEAAKTEANRVRGCQSRVWVVADYDPARDRLTLRGDSDAFISKGLVALVIRLYSGQRPREVAAHEPVVLETIGLGRLVTPGRANGLNAMIARVRDIAAALSAAPTAASGR